MPKRFGFLGLALCVALGGGAAEAALEKLRVRTINIAESPNVSPNPTRAGATCCPEQPFDAVFLDDSTPDEPVLKKLIFKSHETITVQVPGLSASIFLSTDFLEGPGPIGKPEFGKPATFTGTGNTAAGETITWGTVTGWTITGAQYCQSSPPVICNLVPLDGSETTSDPLFHSDFYDLGTWIFHGTGFTATPFVHQYFTPPPDDHGNNQRWIRGFFVVDATVPALPLVGVALIGASLVAGGLAAVSRRHEK